MVIPEDWHEVRLGDIGYFFGGLAGKSAKDFGNGQESFITFMNVMTNVCLSTQGTQSVRIQNGENQNKVQHRDLIFNGSSETPDEVGFGSIVPKELSGVYLNSFCFGFRPTNMEYFDSLYFAYLTRSPLGRKIIRPMAQGSTRYNISKSNLQDGIFPLPPLNEQVAIANALTDADAAIGSLEALIAKKRDIRQATMQQLLNGRMRLPGFAGEWIDVRLGDCATVHKGVQLSKYQIIDGGRYAHLNGGTSASGYTNVFNTEANTIAVSEGGNSCGFVQYMTDRYWSGGHCYAILPQAIDNKFLYHALKGREANIMRLRVGSGLPNVQKSALLAFTLRFPESAEEQIAVAEILTSIDAELDALDSQLSKLRNIKQGMMQNLLTGKVRLV